MIDYKELRNNIKQWVRDVTSLDSGHVINQNSLGTTPRGQYATVRVLDPIREGTATKTYENAPNDTVDITYDNVVKIMVSINIFRDNGWITPLTQMALLKSSLEKVTVQDYFKSVGLGIIDSSESRDLSETVNEKWQERRQCDFFWYVNQQDKENVTAIMKISGDGFGKPYEV